jgi:hypothetical protein
VTAAAGASTGQSPAHVLYSTNVFLKHVIQERFRRDLHWVWCSDVFDPTTSSRYSASSHIPPSSSPAEIYRTLKADVNRGDLHSAKIKEQRANFCRLAVRWLKSGEITEDDKNTIVYWAKAADLQLWRPVIYVIPTAPILSRLQVVPAKHRAGLLGMEYVISDLRRSEFDLIEI